MTGEGITSPCPNSVSFELLDFTVTLCSDRDISTGELKLNTSKYFEMMSKDKDDVILLLNYYIEKSEKNEERTETHVKRTETKPKDQRIRVNDKTATGGWW